MNNKVLSITNFIAFLITLLINGLANGLPINGKTTGELSDLYPNLFVPAGITFSIWGIIYLLLFGFSIYQLILAFNSSKDSPILQAIGPWFLISSIANCSWILAWHYVLPELSLFIMIVLLISLIKIYLNLEKVRNRSMSLEKWIVYPAFSVYLGWITVATIANVTTVLVHWGWNGGSGEEYWTMLMILVAIGMGVYFTILRQNIPYALVIIWALYGIYLKRSSASDIEHGIVLVGQFGMFVCIFSVLYLAIRKFSRSN